MSWWRRRPTSGAPTHFTSRRAGTERTVAIAPRRGVTEREQSDLTERLSAIAWHDLHHAYGPAGDVPALLYAVTLGTDQVRRDAWWELWGNVHHQGTVYEATPACVPFFVDVAANSGHPDRVNALAFLRTIAVGDGTYATKTREAVNRHLPALLDGWEHEPDLVQRALLLLASAFPDEVQDRQDELKGWAFAGWHEPGDDGPAGASAT